MHRSPIASDAEEFALQLLRDQIDAYVYPIHRLDRKTGGVLLFALNEETHKTMQREFAGRKIDKKYLAIVRGYTPDKETIDYPLKKENGSMQEAITSYRTIDRKEIDLPFGKHSTSRYSLIEIYPKSGRKHQIRKHMAHLRHPILADRPHGDNKQNKLFKEKFGLMTMMLHASKLSFKHPETGIQVNISAELQGEFRRILETLSLSYSS